jgi:ubiquinone/menaquinone biosynthesis C-methylase UbiE
MTFNRVAPFYEIGEKFFFGNRLELARTVFAEKFKHSRNVLLLGEGRGSFLNQLLKINKFCNVTVVDSSSRMIQFQKIKISKENSKRVNFICSPLEYFISTEEFDLICSFFFWDCFVSEQMNHLIAKCSQFLQKGGFWVNGDFEDIKSFKNGLNFLKIRLMYIFFHLTTGISAWNIEPFRKYAKSNALESLEIKKIEENFIHTELFQKLI